MEKILATLWKAFSIISIVIFILIVLLAIILFGAGVLTNKKIALISGVLSEHMTEEMIKEAQKEKGAEEEFSPAAYRKQIEEETELKRLELQKDEEELKKIAADIETQRKGVDEREAALQKKISAFQKELEAEKKAVNDAGFKKAVAHIQGLEADSAAETILQFEDKEIVRFLKALPNDFASEVIEAMKGREAQEKVTAPAGKTSRVARIIQLYYGAGEASN